LVSITIPLRPERKQHVAELDHDPRIGARPERRRETIACRNHDLGHKPRVDHSSGEEQPTLEPAKPTLERRLATRHR